MREEPFEILTEIKYRPEINEQTDEEARQGFLEGKAFMVIEIQVIALAEKYQGQDSLTVDYLAACNQKALSSRWMEETMVAMRPSVCCANICWSTSSSIFRLLSKQ